MSKITFTVEVDCCCRTQLQRPRKPSLGNTRQLDMASFGITFTLPPAALPSDVASRELTVTVNGGDPPTTRPYAGNATVSDEWVFAENDHVSAALVDIDGKGNRSQASAAFELDVTDTVPPAQPGTVGVDSIRQID